MGRKSKQQKQFEETFVEGLIDLIRLTTYTNDDAEEKYKIFVKNESLSPYQRKYFKSLMFDNIDYSETRRKMCRLLEKDINKVTFTGKELKNIQRFLREQKLIALK